MPKAARTRSSAVHAKAVPLRRQTLNDGSAEPEAASTSCASTMLAEKVEVSDSSVAPGSDFTEDIGLETLSKKEKQLLKHELFIRRLEASRSPYSKSHERRLKRRAKEQVGKGMDSIKAAISAVEMGETLDEADPQAATGQAPVKPRLAPGQIGEGKHTPLSKNQRKKALALERMRIPKILSTSAFSANPFETIRKHAQNTLVKHEVPK